MDSSQEAESISIVNVHQLHARLGKQLGIPRTFWMEKARSQELPSLVVGNRVLFSIPAVEQWLAGQASRPSVLPPKRKAPAGFGRPSKDTAKEVARG